MNLLDAINAAGRALNDLHRDAKRYRWLRDRMAVEDIPEEHPSWSTPSEEESRKVDAAIDAAMREQGANAELSRAAKRRRLE